MTTKIEKNIGEKDAPDNGPVCTAVTRYFVADIDTQFHSGEAVVKLDMGKNMWHCLFTLRDRIVAAIYSLPIEKDAVVRIIMEKKIEAFNEFATVNVQFNNKVS